MQYQFHKYQATGNDFILIDNRLEIFPTEDNKLINKLCDRRFGVGADGLILLEESDIADFRMRYYNADGDLGSFCGNGSRAAVSFARFLNIVDKTASFEAFDGLHEAIIDGDIIQVKMAGVQNGRQVLNGIFLDTGSPHYVELVANIKSFDVVQKGRELRHSEDFEPNGSNINFVEKVGDNEIYVRTYERGVENETLSCGTGVTAAAIVAAESKSGNIKITTLGGNLSVRFTKSATGYRDIWLEGPAKRVFAGIFAE